MVLSKPICRVQGWLMPWFQFKIWQLALLVVLVAVAIVDVQDHGRREPALVVLAAVGYAAYFLFVWLSWLCVRRYEARLGRTLLVGLYMTAMAVLFLIATVAYLVLEYRYVVGRVF
jgi:hypothetical protein